MNELRIPYKELIDTFEKILLNQGFSAERASLCATLFAKASLDGVASHGLNRFPFFIKTIREGHVDVNAEPALAGSFGIFERWDGQLGPGNLNAWHCMDRAITLARTHGMGSTVLRNTNHWMRAGNFGWQAVENGCIGLCFTNTIPLMPGWGGSDPKLGNNPLVLAVPRKKGALVLDMALSQFAYGKIDSYLRNGKQLPYDGGFDQDGSLTRDPAVILEHELALPIGLWKGAGLALLLDVLASVLSEGRSTHEVGKLEEEHGVSQVFLCFYLPKLGIPSYPDDKIDAIIDDLKASSVFGASGVRFPGEHTLAVRRENLGRGVPVDKDIWDEVLGYIT